MALANYTDLVTAVAAWAHRTDLTAMIPDFITLAEARMNADLMARPMQARVTLTCFPSVRTLALPTDLLEMRRVAVVDSDPAQVLEYKSPDQLMEDAPYIQSAARPVDFTVIGSNLELSPPPDKAYPLELIYIQRIPALTALTPTNWLMTAYPNAYLFGTLLAAMPFTQDDERLAVYGAKYKEAVDAINSIDWYSGSTMRVRVR